MDGDRAASIPEFGALGTPAEEYDVVILGGGLAGMTLALQLRDLCPDAALMVAEKREGRAPEAAFKVGESTVAAGAHYFSEVVGMADHLKDRHLVKCGLRFFLPADGNADITRRIEHGPRAFPPHDNFQIDRGRFENELAARCRRAGVDLIQGCRVGEVELDGERHTVNVSHGGDERSVRARWVVDASGRASILKRQLGLSREVGHKVNSSWFRLAGGLDLEEWGADNEDWMSRMLERGIRKFSTNHLLGEGYWIWLIPLGSGSISIGVCTDSSLHQFEEISDFESLLGWLSRHEPQLAAAVDSRRDDIEDFLRVEDYAYGCERAYSPERWCLVGEAAAFPDPLYSPGSDFISYGNTFVSDLIARDLAGQDIGERIEYYNSFYFHAYEHTLAYYEGQFPIFANPQVAVPKLIWDTTMQHWAPALLLVNGKLTDLEFMRAVEDDVLRAFRLNARVQRLFGEWHERDKHVWESLPLNAIAFKPFFDVVVGISQRHEDAALGEMLARNADAAEAAAVLIFHKAASRLSLPVDAERPVNPYAISLDPERWEADGLYGAPGLTAAQAAERAPGIENVWMDEVAAAG